MFEGWNVPIPEYLTYCLPSPNPVGLWILPLNLWAVRPYSLHFWPFLFWSKGPSNFDQILSRMSLTSWLKFIAKRGLRVFFIGLLNINFEGLKCKDL